MSAPDRDRAEQSTVAVFLPDLCGLTALFVVAVVSELVALIVVVSGHGIGRSFIDELALMSLYTQWIGLSAAGTLCLTRRYLNRMQPQVVVPLSYSIIVLVTYGVAELAWWVVAPFVSGIVVIDLSRQDFLLRTILIGAVVAALVLRYFYVQFHYKQRIASEAQARLQALQARIRPHFFFNCMNSIASLTRSDPTSAERAVEDLADLFRASLSDAAELVPLADEIAFVERYLSIEKLRLGARLQVEWSLDKSTPGALLPLLSLQPLVENAIYHGIEPAADGGIIEIHGEISGNKLAITVSNPTVTPRGPHQSGNRMAQDNVRQRLGAHFGDAATLTSGQQDGAYSATLTVPLIMP